MPKTTNCDNTNCEEGTDRVIMIMLTEDFNNETCYWCYDCRKRDRDMIKMEIKKSVIVNCNLEIFTPETNEDKAKQFAMDYELPSEYVEDSFEIVKVINADE